MSIMTAQFILSRSCKSTEGTAKVLSYSATNDGVLRSNRPTPFLWNELVKMVAQTQNFKKKKSNMSNFLTTKSRVAQTSFNIF